MSNNQETFFELLRAGLWERDVELKKYGFTDYAGIMRLAEEQSVVGLITVGLEHVKDEKIHQERAFQFIGSTIRIEERNKSMNLFVSQLIERLRKNGIYAILVKGQGIAQCYEQPLRRSAGDVDLLLSDENYLKASRELRKIAATVEEENLYNQHLAMTIDGWQVELHGTLRSGLWKCLDKRIDIIQGDIFYGGKVRSWINGKTQVFLPGIDEDVFLVFAHILQHYYQEGIGLRQICDWCRLLWTYRESLNHELLESRIRNAGIMSEWKTFAALAVEYLGMRKEAMPFYISSRRWRRKANSVMRFVMYTGNFGHNRDYSYYDKHTLFGYKTISLWRHTKDFLRYLYVFPLNAVKVYWSIIVRGVRVATLGK